MIKGSRQTGAILNVLSLALLLTILSVSQLAVAQFTSGADFENPTVGTDSLASPSDEFYVLDAVVERFYQGQPFVLMPLDTGLWWFHRFNPAYKNPFGYTDLGNLGTAARPVVFRPVGQVGFDAGRHAFDPYTYSLEELNYFRANKPYTQLYYVLGSDLEQMFNVRHTQQPFPNLNFAVDYTRIVSVGPITHHKTGISRLGMTAWYRSPGRRYAAQVGFAFNDVDNQENWGLAISDDSATNVIREEIPVNLSSPETMEVGNALQFKQYWNLGPAYTRVYNDSVSISKIFPQNRLYHDFRFKRQRYTYEDLAVDSAFYSEINFNSDTTITNFGYRRFINRLGLQTTPFKMKGDSLVPNQLQYNLALGWDAGYYEDSSIREDVSIGFLEAQLQLSPSENNPLYVRAAGKAATTREFEIDASIGIVGFKRVVNEEDTTIAVLNKQGAAATSVVSKPDTVVRDSTWLADSIRLDSLFAGLPDLKLEQSLVPPVEKELAYEIGAGVRVSRLRASKIMDRMVANHGIWLNNFSAQNSLSPYLQLRSRKTRTALEVRYTLVDNFLYWDTDARPAQASATQSVFAVLLSQDFKLGYFHFDNEIAVQLSTSGLINLPVYRGRHNFYFQKSIFRNALFAQLGVDIVYNTPYQLDRYDPFTAQYYLQNTEERSFVPDVDVYFSAIVKRARFFLKGRYLTGGFQTPVNFQSIGYPSEGFGIELGVDWAFWY